MPQRIPPLSWTRKTALSARCRAGLSLFLKPGMMRSRGKKPGEILYDRPVMHQVFLLMRTQPTDLRVLVITETVQNGRSIFSPGLGICPNSS